MLKATTDIQPWAKNYSSPWFDIYATRDVNISAGETTMYRLGVRIDLDALSLARIGGRYSEFKDVIDGHNERIIELFETFLKAHYIQVSLSDEMMDKGLVQSSIDVFSLKYMTELKINIYRPNSAYDVIEAIDGNSGSTLPIKKGDKVAKVMLLKHNTPSSICGK